MCTSALRAGVIALLVIFAGCEQVVERVRGGGTDTAPRGVLTLSMEAPGVMRVGEDGVIRLTLWNRADTVVHQVRADLFLPAWVELVTPDPTGRAVTVVASGEGTRLSYALGDPPLQPGESVSVAQRIRFPGMPGEDSDVWMTRRVQAWLVGPDGQPLGAQVETELVIDTTGMQRGDRQAQTGQPVVGAQGVDPVRLGMPERELRSAVPQARDTTWQLEGMTERGMIVPLAEGRTVTALTTEGSVSRIYITDPGVRTAEGHGVGSRMEALRGAYGRACAGTGEGTVVVWFPDKPGISFVLDTPVPQNPDEIRRDPQRIPGSATVRQMFVRRGADSC